MLLQDEQYIVHWLTQYGPLPQTQIVCLLRHKPPEVAAKIIRGLKRQQMIFDIAGGYYLGVDPMGQPDQRIIHAVWVLLQFADKVEPMAHYSRTRPSAASPAATTLIWNCPAKKSAPTSSSSTTKARHWNFSPPSFSAVCSSSWSATPTAAQTSAAKYPSTSFWRR